MWQVIEHVAVAAPPRRVWRVVSDLASHADLAGGQVGAIRLRGPLEVGTTFETDFITPERGSFVTESRIDVVREPHELSWTSHELHADDPAEHPCELHWWFRLAPGWTGTDIEYGCRARTGEQDHAAAVRDGMLLTLANLKAKVELSDR